MNDNDNEDSDSSLLALVSSTVDSIALCFLFPRLSLILAPSYFTHNHIQRSTKLPIWATLLKTRAARVSLVRSIQRRKTNPPNLPFPYACPYSFRTLSEAGPCRFHPLISPEKKRQSRILPHHPNAARISSIYGDQITPRTWL